MASRGFVIYDREIRYFMPVLIINRTAHNIAKFEIKCKNRKTFAHKCRVNQLRKDN